MMPYDAYYAAENTILNYLTMDAIGPVSPEEVLQEPPLDSYVCGILWPQRTPDIPVRSAEFQPQDRRFDAAPDSNFGAELEDEPSDVIREANQFRPCVMAISFTLPVQANSVCFTFSAGQYKNHDIPVEGKNYTLHEYSRISLNTGKIQLQLPQQMAEKYFFDNQVRLQILRRRNNTNDTTLWTVSIENQNCASQNEIAQNISAFFQCQLNLEGQFLPMDQHGKAIGNPDRRKQDFLYRNVHNYAVGHGCSVSWDSNASEIHEIKSAFMPRAVVSQMIATTGQDLSCFKMNAWSDKRRATSLDELASYVQRYGQWAEKLKQRQLTFSKNDRMTAETILVQIHDCICRLNEGIRVLRKNDMAWKAFVLTQRAMMRQSAKRREQPENAVSWYPFQLCYVVMCILDIVEPHSRWRNVVDLLWFPTGGGKTEAYLGVAAFTIFYRRLMRGERGNGTTVLMRYTLRMLTAQQFERAAALICECDFIRREEHLPGGEISIGLWIGGEATPNHVTSDYDEDQSASSILQKLKQNHLSEVRSTPIQLSACPFCKTPLTVHDSYEIKNGHFTAHCPSPSCPFHADLPVVTVDDDVYSRRPTLLIGTIDKFARLAWDEKTGSIFSEDGQCEPPELMIQDELHLISGPLGSVSGLYEIAIEKLCESDGVPPKILASTATLCNAEEQIAALYGRTAFQFPPSGFEADDSFFAKTAAAEERPQRQYLGFCETGGSLPDALVRVFGVIRFALQVLIEQGTDEKVIDQYWTNVAYFNSLKDLGSADTLIIDRVCAYAENLRRHKFRKIAMEYNIAPILKEYEYGELTSRKSAREITMIRNQLDEQHYPSNAALNYVLSSNMLSVGIDINRLGLMTVYGQPKSTSEYIQATSRVGRSNPGLVVVLLHMLRTRDKSHYEQFQSYHQALNKMVEPTSATPFACRTMEKALHAVFIILLRHQCGHLRSNSDAAAFRKDNPDVNRIKQELLRVIRAHSVESAQYAEEILNDFIDTWHEAAISPGSHLQYQLLSCSENDTTAVLIPAEKSENALFPPTMNSMRNVDTQSGVFLKG